MFDATVRDGVLRVTAPGVRWLSTGWAGGFCDADAAYNVSVPEGWSRTDLDAYVRERRERAKFPTDGPALLTGVDLTHLRGARSGSVVVYATAGVSNPAALPMEADGEGSADLPTETHAGTVNLIVGTTRTLDDAAVANLLAVAVEAKTATLLATTGFPGTTTDAVVVGTRPNGTETTFSGSATPVGAATRACVRDAVRASLESRYTDPDEDANRGLPESIADAKYGTSTTRKAEVFAP